METNNFFNVTDSMLADILKEYVQVQKRIATISLDEHGKPEVNKEHVKKDVPVLKHSDANLIEINEPKCVKSFIKQSFATETVPCTIFNSDVVDKRQKPDLYSILKTVFDTDFETWKNSKPLKRPERLKLNFIGVALFKGKEIISKAIRKITKSRYSHVALLLSDATKDKKDENGWYVYSANGSISQILKDHIFPHVQLEKWSEILQDYDGAVGVRMCLFDIIAQPSSILVTHLIDKYLGLPFERQLLVMLKALNRANVENGKSAESAFCSEICYRFLVDLGVVDDTEVPENVWPKDFSDENDKLPLRNGQWGPVLVYKGKLNKMNSS